MRIKPGIKHPGIKLYPSIKTGIVWLGCSWTKKIKIIQIQFILIRYKMSEFGPGPNLDYFIQLVQSLTLCSIEQLFLEHNVKKLDHLNNLDNITLVINDLLQCNSKQCDE